MDNPINCIVHAGAPKCGSSSLQAALSSRPIFSSINAFQSYEYVSIIAGYERLCRGRDLIDAAKLSPAGYCASSAAVEWAENKSFIESLNKDLKAITTEKTIPIVSYEGWTWDASLFADHEILPRLGVNAKVILFIRPQIPWINSAWWQWGAWSGSEFNTWFENLIKPCLVWADVVRSWKSVPGVEQVEVYPASRDVTATFFQSINARPSHSGKVNTSLDADVLRFFQRHPEFRPHETAHEIDFVLQRWLPQGSKGTPWVVPQSTVRELMEFYRPGNEELLSLMSPAERGRIQDDPRWWDAQAYEHLEVAPLDAPAPRLSEAEELTRRAVHAIAALDEQLRQLRSAADAHAQTQSEMPRPPGANADTNARLQEKVAELNRTIEALTLQLSVARSNVRGLAEDLQRDRSKLLPYWFRKSFSANGLRRLIDCRT